MAQVWGLPRLPTVGDYWGAGVYAPQQETAEAIIVPETDNRSQLPMTVTPDSRASVWFLLALMAVVAGGVMLAHWVEGE